MQYGSKTVTKTFIKREDITTGLSYEDLIIAFEYEMGRWDPVVENSLVQQKAPWEKVKSAIQGYLR
jgi:hypothetical protein